MTASIDTGGAPSPFPSGWNPGGMISAVPQERTAWMRETSGRRRLHLVTLWDGMPGLTPSLGGSLAEAAAVCLEDQGHGAVVDLTVEGHFEEVFALERSPVDEQMRSSHRHQEKATENGACGVALAAVCELTGLTVLRQASRARVRQKVEQTKRWKQYSNPALVAVVEFGRPVMRIMKI